MNEQLIYQKVINDNVIYRIYTRFNRYKVKTEFRHELWICKDLDDIDYIDLPEKEALAILGSLNYSSQALYPILPPSRKTLYSTTNILGIGIVYGMDAQKYNKLYISPSEGSSFTRGVYSSEYIYISF